MTIDRRVRTLAALALWAGAAGCRIGGSSDEASQAAPADPAQAGGVVRYGAGEILETGQASVRQTVAARSAADVNAAAVGTLVPGTVVNRVARYGAFSLVSWSGAGGAQQGWVDANAAFSVRTVDAGTRPPTFGTVQPPPPPATTAAPPPTTPKTSAAPPATTAAPPPTTPKTSAPPPPKPTATATGSKSFRPPKIGK